MEPKFPYDVDCPNCEIPEQMEREEFSLDDSGKTKNQRTSNYENHNEETIKLERRIDELDKEIRVVDEDTTKLNETVNNKIEKLDEWACQTVEFIKDNINRLDKGLCSLQANARNNDIAGQFADFKMEIFENIQNLQEKDEFEDLKGQMIENFQEQVDAIEDLRDAEINIKTEMSKLKIEMEEFKIWKEERMNSEELNEENFEFNEKGFKTEIQPENDQMVEIEEEYDEIIKDLGDENDEKT